MNVPEVMNWQICESRALTSDDIDRLLQVIDSLRRILFTREITLDHLIYQLSLPLVFITQQPARGTQATELIGDFFLLSLRDFLCKHLSVLAGLSPEQKQTLFRVKSRLSCALHFNYDMTEIAAADERRHREQEATLTATVDNHTLPARDARRLADAPPLDTVYTKRVAFLRNDTLPFPNASSSAVDTTRVFTIESFCPTFALYTVVNLHGRFALDAHTGRFSASALLDDAGHHLHTGGGSDRVKRYERKRRAADNALPGTGSYEADKVFRDTRIAQPPHPQAWYAFCQESDDGNAPLGSRTASAFWPKQIVLQNARDMMNDPAMRALLHRLARSDANESGNVDSASKARPLLLSDSGHARSRKANLSNGQGGDDTHCFVQRHQYTNDVESYVNQQRRLRHVNHSDASQLNVCSDFKQQYTSLLHRFSINWAKLHFMEPRVFGKSDTLRV